jgi:predicted dinucleotide-binding enzyme
MPTKARITPRTRSINPPTPHAGVITGLIGSPPEYVGLAESAASCWEAAVAPSSEGTVEVASAAEAVVDAVFVVVAVPVPVAVVVADVDVDVDVDAVVDASVCVAVDASLDVLSPALSESVSCLAFISPPRP